MQRDRINPATAPMSIQQKIILRYRTQGHVRFELPEGLCSPEQCERLVSGLRRIEGVFRVDMYRRQRKLSIRYIDAVLDFSALLRGFDAVVTDMEMTGTPGDHSRQSSGFPKRKKPLILDILAAALIIYLLKVHWRRITRQWLRDPIRYRYELLALFFLLFLHLRPRMAKRLI